MFSIKSKTLTILTIGMIVFLSSCDLQELDGLQPEIRIETNTESSRNAAPDPSVVIKKVIERDCLGATDNREFDVYITPDAFAFYCDAGNSLDYHFVEGENSTPIVFNSNQQSSRFSLPSGTKYTLELYTASGNILVSTSLGFQLDDCLPGLVEQSDNPVE